MIAIHHQVRNHKTAIYMATFPRLKSNIPIKTQRLKRFLGWKFSLAEPPPGAVATGLPMAKGRSLSQFQEAFPDEACCAAFLVRRRWLNGFVCPGCAGRRAAALKSRAYTYECSSCGRQTSITAGTAMHRTRLPLTTWFLAAPLMATHSNGMSARPLADQIGVN